MCTKLYVILAEFSLMAGEKCHNWSACFEFLYFKLYGRAQSLVKSSMHHHVYHGASKTKHTIKFARKKLRW